jgi:hypothetical protein|nr:MAG TPA: hypothetical protein [Caudoviricetes sp.]
MTAQAWCEAMAARATQAKEAARLAGDYPAFAQAEKDEQNYLEMAKLWQGRE